MLNKTFRLPAAVLGMALTLVGLMAAPAAATEAVPIGGYAVRVHLGGEVMTVPGSSTTSGDQLVVDDWFRLRPEDQTFWFVPLAGGYHRIETPAGLCVDVQAVSQDDGARVIQWPCHDGPNQQWQVEHDDGEVLLRARHSGRFLASDGDGGLVQRDRTGAVRWVLEDPPPPPPLPEVCDHTGQLPVCRPWPW